MRWFLENGADTSIAWELFRELYLIPSESSYCQRFWLSSRQCLVLCLSIEVSQAENFHIRPQLDKEH